MSEKSSDYWLGWIDGMKRASDIVGKNDWFGAPGAIVYAMEDEHRYPDSPCPICGELTRMFRPHSCPATSRSSTR